MPYRSISENRANEIIALFKTQFEQEHLQMSEDVDIENVIDFSDAIALNPIDLVMNNLDQELTPYFEISINIFNTPRNVRPNDHELANIHPDDIAQLQSRFIEKIREYCQNFVAEYNPIELESIESQQPELPELPELPQELQPQHADNPVAMPEPEIEPQERQPEVNYQRYENWYRNLNQNHRKILQNQMNNLSAAERNLINVFIPQDINIRHELYNKARLYHFYHDCIREIYRDQNINLDTIITHQRTRNANGNNINAADRNEDLNRLNRAELQGRILEQRLQRLENNNNLFSNLAWFYMWRNLFRPAYPAYRPYPVYNVNDRRRDDRNNRDANNKSILAPLIIALVLVTSSLSMLIYSFKKAKKSINNIYNDHKKARSIGRLIAMTCGILLGMTLSSLPALVMAAFALTSVTTAILAITFGAIAGSAIFAFSYKHIAQIFSAVFNRNEISSTNPEKYKLTRDQQSFLAGVGVNINTLNRLLKHIKSAKDKKWFSKNFFWTEGYCDNKTYNKLIEQIKNGEILGVIEFDDEVYRLFDRHGPDPDEQLHNIQIERRNIEPIRLQHVFRPVRFDLNLDGIHRQLNDQRNQDLSRYINAYARAPFMDNRLREIFAAREDLFRQQHDIFRFRK